MYYEKCLSLIDQNKYVDATILWRNTMVTYNNDLSESDFLDIINRIINHFNFDNYDLSEYYRYIYDEITNVSVLYKCQQCYPRILECIREECIRYLKYIFDESRHVEYFSDIELLFVQQSMNNFRRIIKRFFNNQFTYEELSTILKLVEYAVYNNVRGAYSVYNSFILFYDYTLIIDDVIIFIDAVGKILPVSSSKIILNDIQHNNLVSGENKQRVYYTLERSMNYRKLTVMRG